MVKRSDKNWKKSRRQRRSHRPEANSGRNSEYNLGVVIVHGVGNPEPGDTVDKIAPRIVETLDDQGTSASFEMLDLSKDLGEMRIEDSHRILFADAHWASIVTASRIGGIKGLAVRLKFVLSVFPYLLVGAIGPRSNSSNKDSKHERSWLATLCDIEIEEIRGLAPTLWRFLGPIFGLVGLAATFLYAWWAGIAVLGFLILVLVIVLAWPNNVVEHVRFAVAAGAELEQIQRRVSKTIAEVEQRCDRVWLLAHSQGGFVAHKVLLETPHPRVERFTAIASGLRPLKLATLAQNKLWILGGWVHLLGSFIMCIAVLMGLETGGFLSFEFANQLFSILVEPIVFPFLLFFPAAFVELLPEISLIGWNGLGTLLLGLGLIAVGIFLRGKAPVQWEIEDLPAEISWEEISSPSDIVGSMSEPPMPERVTELPIPSMRNAFGDHGLKSYFSQRGALRFMAAATLTQEISGDTRAEPSRAIAKGITSRLNLLSRQTYVFRGSLMLAVLFFSVGIPVFFGGTVFDILVETLPLAVVTSIVGWCMSYSRWSRLAPRIVKNGLTPTAKETKKIARKLRNPPRASVARLQGLLIACALATAFGLQRVVTQLKSLGMPIFKSDYLEVATTNVMSSVLFLSAGAVCLSARMNGVKLCNTVALIYTISAMANIILAGPIVQPGLLSVGVFAVSALLVLLLIHVSRRTWKRESFID